MEGKLAGGQDWKEAFALANLPSDLVDELDEQSIFSPSPSYPTSQFLLLGIVTVQWYKSEGTGKNSGLGKSDRKLNFSGV